MKVISVTKDETSLAANLAYLVGGTLLMVAPFILWIAGLV